VRAVLDSGEGSLMEGNGAVVRLNAGQQDGDEASFAFEFFLSGGLEVTIVILVFRAHVTGVREVREIDIGAYFHLLREP